MYFSRDATHSDNLSLSIIRKVIQSKSPPCPVKRHKSKIGDFRFAGRGEGGKGGTDIAHARLMLCRKQASSRSTSTSRSRSSIPPFPPRTMQGCAQMGSKHAEAITFLRDACTLLGRGLVGGKGGGGKARQRAKHGGASLRR